jgi:hypothetical protein
MPSGPLYVVSFPFERLKALTDDLGALLLEDDEIRRAHDAPHRPRELAREPMVERAAAVLGAKGLCPALLVYQPPWKFLERQLRLMSEPPLSEPEIEGFAVNALRFWRAYQEGLLDLAGRADIPGALLNADRPYATGALSALTRERFGREAREPAQWGSVFPSSSEESYWQVVNRVAPDCLALYGTLESRAGWMGRQPEPGRGRFPVREGALSSLLRAELAALAPRYEAELYRAQLAQVEQELARQAELNRQKDRQIADLTRRAEGRIGPVLRRVAGLAARLRAAAVSRAVKLPFAGPFVRAARRRVFSRQVQRVRASGIFDEQWYLKKYPDIAQAGLDPVEHYLAYGVGEGRNPSADFNTRGYLSAHPDVAAAGMNPLLHYIQFGQREGRRPRKSRAAALEP